MSDAGDGGATRLRRIRLRSWRRGIREMDLILGPFADAGLSDLGVGEFDAFESLLLENDHDLYQWISGRGDTPEAFKEIVDRIRRHHRIG
jgi:antitoxin CptB